MKKCKGISLVAVNCGRWVPRKYFQCAESFASRAYAVLGVPFMNAVHAEEEGQIKGAAMCPISDQRGQVASGSVMQRISLS